VALDSVDYYARTPDYFDAPRTRGSLQVNAGMSVYTFALGTMPTTVALGGIASYWVDGETPRDD
jgi:hypothetical protein